MTAKDELVGAISEFYSVIRPVTASACRLSAYPYCDYGQAHLLFTTQADDKNYPEGNQYWLLRSVACYPEVYANNLLTTNVPVKWLLMEEVRKHDRNSGHIPVDLKPEELKELGRLVIPMHLSWLGVVNDKVIEVTDGVLGGEVGDDDMHAIATNLLCLLDLYARTDRSKQAAKNGLWGIYCSKISS